MASPKNPEDHKVKKSEEFAEEAETPPVGAELLRPAASLPSWDRLDLVALLQETFEALGINIDDADAEFDIDPSSPDALRALAKMQRGLLPVAIDERTFIAYASTPEAIETVTNLAMWYLGALGESMGSAA